jgi:hypothetical protein
MAETIYQYSISTDTANGIVSTGKLKSEIQNSAEILISLNRIDTIGDNLNIIFNATISSAENDKLDAIVAVHDGVSIATITPVRIQETAVANRNLRVKGIYFIADLDSTTLYDIQFTEDRELQNVFVCVKDHTDGDYMEFEAVIPDSVETVVSVWGETVYVPHSGEIHPDSSFDTSTIPAGLILRFKYISVGTSGPQPSVIAHLRTHV